MPCDENANPEVFRVRSLSSRGSCFKSFEETENNLEAEAAYASAGLVLSEAEGLSTGDGWAYDRILAGDYRWSAWAEPDRGLTGDQ